MNEMMPLPSPNHEPRRAAAVDMLVLHYTGMPTADHARAWASEEEKERGQARAYESSDY